MTEIIGELDAAGNLLQAALDRYLRACSALQGCFTHRNAISCLPLEPMHRVTEELIRVNSYKARIKEAEVAIKKSRNCCAGIVPIEALPDEILGQIFHLVRDAQACTIVSGDRFRSACLNYTDLSSYVCSRWRQISISLGTLWSHIDLDLGSRNKSLARAVVYAARAAHSPLDVHITDTGPAENQSDAYAEVASFLSSIGPRIKALQLSSNCAFKKYYPSILRVCFKSCVPGVLTRLVLGRGPSGYRFFEAAEDPQIPGSLLMDLPKQLFEDLWHHIQVLQLFVFCPPWTSKAYYGLTKLRLLSKESEICIPEQQLIEILRSSPQLRVLFFDANITDPLPPDVPLVPVHLECLEALAWKSLPGRPNQLGTFLRLIAPGLNSLWVSIDGFEKVESVWLGEIEGFFARSNVTNLRMRPIKPRDSGCISADLLNPLPPLEVLTLQWYDVPGAIPHSTQYHQTNELRIHPTQHSCFETLQLLQCKTHVDELRRIIQTHSVQMLTVQCGNIISGSDEPYSYWKNSMSEEKINERLRDICAVAKFEYEEDPRLMKDWDNDTFDLV